MQSNPVVGKWNNVDDVVSPEPYEANGRGLVLAVVPADHEKTVELKLRPPKVRWTPTFRLAAIRVLEFLLAWFRA